MKKISMLLADVVVKINYYYFCGALITITLIQRIIIDYNMVMLKMQW